MASRSESSKHAILQATLTLLSDESHGPIPLRKLSIERIAREAGVSKMTIYRWWETKAALVIDSFLENHVARTPVRDDGPAIDALREHLTSLAEVYAGPEGRLVAQLIAECQTDPATLEQFKRRFWAGRVEAVTKLIRRAVAEGSVSSASDPSVFADFLYAPIYFRLLFQVGKLDAQYVETLFEAALAGFGTES